MSGISTGVGLVSGINTAQLIEQLLAIDARPKTFVQEQNAVLTSQQVAYQDINAKLLVLKLSVGTLTNTNTYKTTSSVSSNEAVLKATTNASTTPGTYSFSVARLVTSQQSITRGYANSESGTIGTGTITVETAAARLDTDTELSILNGGEGITRGKIRITDRSGSSTVVDLSKAITVKDVLTAINNASGINVSASVDGDRLKLTDNTGTAVTSLSVTDVAGSGTTASLGFNVAAVGTTLTGTKINRLGDDTALASLNDGNGVRVSTAQADFRITRRDGTTFDVDLNSESTLGQVLDTINTASGGNVTASVASDGVSLQLVDSTSGGSELSVTALNSSNAASDLGILSTVTGGGDTLSGQRLLANLNSKLLKNLNGGAGIGLGTISITNRSGAATNVDLSTARSIDEVLSLINNSGAQVNASLNSAGNGILLSDQTGASASNLIVADVSGTSAADLNLTASVAVNSYNSGNLQFKYITESTRLADLNGGLGITRGQFKITDSNGLSANVDLTQGNETTIGDVITEINSRGLAVTARINDNGDGILIEDTGSGTSKLKIEEAGATTAADLGLLGEATNAGDDFNGTFEKTLTLDGTETLKALADKINAASLNVRATILNDGSAANPYRLSLTSSRVGEAGALIIDDGNLNLGITQLSEGKNAVVFYGSSDPAKGLAITSTTNSLTTLIPGATIDLLSTSDNPVTLTVSRDTSTITGAVDEFVEKFNSLIDTINKYDSYDSETEQRGLLLGDSSLNTIRSTLYRLVNNRNNELTTQYTSLSQVGIKVISGGKLSVDSAKLASALSTDSAAVEALFSYKVSTTTDGVTTLTKGGVGARIEQSLANFTESTNGLLVSRLNSIDSQIELGNQRIERYDEQLADKRKRYEFQFQTMEKTLATLQSQSAAISKLGS